MALVSKIGSFTAPSGAGAQAITGVGFQPKCVMFWGGSVTSTSVVSAASRYQLGFDDGTNRIATSSTAGAFFGVNQTEHMWGSGYSLMKVRLALPIHTLEAYGRIQTMDADGFTIDWTKYDNTSGPVQWNYCAMADGNIGSGEVVFKVGTFTEKSSTGSQSITGLGFSPVAIILLATGGVPGSVLEGTGWMSTIGFGVSAAKEGVTAGFVNNGSPASATHYERTNQVLARIGATSAGPLASVTSLDADGFTLNYGTAGSSFLCGYLAIGGTNLTADIGTVIEPAATGNQTVSTSIAPRLVFLTSAGATPSTTVDADLLATLGASNVTDTRAEWTANQNGVVGTPKAFSRHRDTETMTFASAATNAIDGSAAVTALNNTDFILNWTAVQSGGGRELVFLVLGTASAASGSITVTKIATPVPGGPTIFAFTTTGGLSPSTFNLTDGQSRVFGSLGAGTYGITETQLPQWSISYTVSDGSPHDAIVLSAGGIISVTVTNTLATTSTQLRRLRRFQLAYDENFAMTVPRIEIIAQMGVGNAAAPNPVIQLRISKDGGKTFGAFRSMSIGAAAEYTKRAYLTRVARGRNLVAELICDDPVFVAWVQATAQILKGTS